MSITSQGYAGTIEDDDWAEMIPQVGVSRYGVAGITDWKVSIGAGTRQVQVAAGVGFGRGVRDVSSTQETLTLGTVPTGSRWDLIVARRNWSTGATTFEVVAGGSSKALPARTTTPGVVDEQPIALARVTAGQASVQEIVDLRIIPANGVAVGFDPLARSYMAWPGTQLLIDGVLWTRQVNALGSSEWASMPLSDTGWQSSGLSVPDNNRFDVESYKLRRVGDHIQGTVRMKHSASSAPSMGSDGSFSQVSVVRMPVGWRPATPGAIDMRGDSSDVPFFAVIDTDGLVTARWGVPGNPLSSNGIYRLTINYLA